MYIFSLSLVLYRLKLIVYFDMNYEEYLQENDCSEFNIAISLE